MHEEQDGGCNIDCVFATIIRMKWYAAQLADAR